MPKRFPAVQIRQVHFDKRKLGGKYGIAQRDTGVGKAAEIDDHERGAISARQVQALNELRFVIALQASEFVSGLGALAGQSGVDVCQRVIAIYMWLAAAEEVQIGPVQGQDRCHE